MVVVAVNQVFWKVLEESSAWLSGGFAVDAGVSSGCILNKLMYTRWEPVLIWPVGCMTPSRKPLAGWPSP